MSANVALRPLADPVQNSAPELTLRVPPEPAETTTLSDSSADFHISGMVVCCGVFAVAFALYILYPAVSTLLGV